MNQRLTDIRRAQLDQLLSGGTNMAGGGLLKAVALKPAAKAAKPAAKAVTKVVEAAPQAEALRLAQQRAALPPAKGGLGLPKNNTPEQRAKAMGINTDAYHGTKQDIKGAFVPGYNDDLAFVTKDSDFANKWVGKGKMQKRVGAEAEQKSAEDLYRALKHKHMDFESLDRDDPNFHAEYDKRNNAFKEAFAKEAGLDPDRTHSAVYPMKVEANKTFNPETDMDVMAEYFAKNNTPQEIVKHFQHGNYLVYENQPVVDFLKSKGYDSMRLRESTDDNFPTIAVFNPETIRSRFAAFDPFRKTAATAAAMGVAAPDLLAKEQDKAKGGLVHLAGGGDPKKADSQYPLMGDPSQFAESSESKLYPKTERMNRGVKAIKSGLDSFNRFIDQGPSVRDVLGNVVGAVPFVGPDLRKGMEDSTLTIPYGFERSLDNPKVATGVQTAKVPTTDILDALKMSDITGGTGASNLLESVGKGYAPDPMDVLDTLGLGAAGYGVAKAGAKGVKGTVLAGKEAKAAKEIETAGTKYATQQEGPFFRVQPTTLGKDAATTRGTKEADGLRATPAVAGGAEPTGRKVPQLLSPEEVGRIIADPIANQPLNIAKKYTKDTQGVDFGVPKTPSSSLAKQSAIGRTFDLAVQGSPEYKSAIFGAYSREMPDLMEQIGAKNYDDLMEKAYRQMAKETDDQFKQLPYNFSYHRAGEGNYNGAKDMASDVHGNRHLYVYQGGDKHDFLHNVDPQTGLNENEKFRAVHDLLGHAIYGNEFGPKGEEMAWAVHQQMYSPLARMAMTAETRGQNSVVNYSPLNAKLKKTIAEYESLSNEARRRGDKALVKEIEELKRQAYSGLEFAPNKAVLLPPEFMNPQFTGGMPLYLKAANRPTKGTETGSVLTHYSNEPNLQLIDPTRYGTGIKGAEAERLMHFPGGVRDRSYFYLGEPGAVAPEAGLGGNRYRGESSSLYDITQDPLDFKLLAREANRTPFTARANAGVTYPLQEANDYERLVKEYGYEGMINPNATKPMGIMFEPTKVEPRMAGGGSVGLRNALNNLLRTDKPEVHMQVGGAAKVAAKAAEAAKVAGKAAEYLPGVHYADPLKMPTMKMSEALGNAGAEGKTLNFTETDRSRVFGPNRGGTGFSGLQHYSLPHKEANTVWGFGNKTTAEKKIRQNDPENTIWTTYAGSPNQHKSNTIVVKDALSQLQSANSQGLVNSKQIEFINKRIREAVSQNGNPLFPKDFDITNPKAFDYATTFDRRAAISDALIGIGVKKPMISKEFKAANPGVKWSDAANIDAILRRETDPAMLDANTFDVGPHLFTMDNGVIERPDLNEAFPYQVTGTDLGLRYKLAPMRAAAPDWIKARNIKPNEPINAWAMSRAAPSQFVSEAYLTSLQKQGKKKGGLAQIKKVKRHGNTVPH